jgi:hypothetical protein
MRLESTGCDFESRRAEPIDKVLIKPIGDLRRSRVRKRRPIAPSAVPVQGKLRNHQNFAAAVTDDAVHLALIVLENAKILNLVGERVGVLFVILFADAKEDAKAGTDLTDCFPPHVNMGFGDSLHNGTHNQRVLKEAGDILSLQA